VKVKETVSDEAREDQWGVCCTMIPRATSMSLTWYG